MPSSYEKKYDQFLEGWTGKKKEEREKDEKAHAKRFQGIKNMFGFGKKDSKKKMPKSKYTK